MPLYWWGVQFVKASELESRYFYFYLKANTSCSLQTSLVLALFIQLGNLRISVHIKDLAKLNLVKLVMVVWIVA